MLNYGSAAQIYFGYNTDVDAEDAHSGLVNLNIEDESKRKSTLDDFTDVTASNAIVQGSDTAGKALTYNAMNGQFKQQIALALRYKLNSSVEVGEVDTLTFRGTYTDVLGGEQTVTVDGSTFEVTGSKTKYYMLYVDTVAAKDLRCTITGAIYDENDVQVSNTIEVSLESYAVNVLAGTNTNMKALALATLAYSDAVAYQQTH